MSAAIPARFPIYRALQSGPLTCREIAQRTGLVEVTVRVALNRGSIDGYFRKHGAPTFLHSICGRLPSIARRPVTREERDVMWQLSHRPMPMEEIAGEVLYPMKMRKVGEIVRFMASRRGWLELAVDGNWQLTDTGRRVLSTLDDVEAADAAE